MELEVYRGTADGPAVTATFKVSESSTYAEQLMGEHKITCSGIIATSVLNIQLGDFIYYDGQPYFINTVPGYTKHSNIRYEYSITFEAEYYRWYDKIVMQNGEFVTDYFGYPLLYLQLLVDNINEIDPGWSVGMVDDAPELHIAFEEGVSCRSALTTIAEAFKMEYFFTNKTVHLVKAAGAMTSLSFSQGKGNGLYTFVLQARNDANLVTRVYVKGGTKNIPPDYRPNAAGIGATRLRIPSVYLEQNVELYGVKEGEYINEEIYPKRTAAVTWAGDVGETTFFIADTTLDFNINDQLMEGLDARVEFKTGDLAGYGFTISNYDHATKTFRLNVDKEQKPNPMPNATFQPKAGDLYTLVDLRMPQTYVEQAETDVLAEGQQYLDINSRPSAVFNLNLDELYVRNNGIRLKPGDRVNVKEPGLGIDAMIRTTAVSWPLLNPDKISATIADFIPYTRQERLIRQTIENRKETVFVDRLNAELARRTAARFRELRGLIQDPDGYFDSTKLKPNSIETLFLSVGAKSQNFGLNNVLIEPNYNGDPSQLYISAGQLIHYEVEIEGLGYVWQLQESLFTGLDPAKAYYIAAKCERTALRGTWSVTEDFKITEAEPGVWYFNLGILYAVKDGYRDYQLTKGMTTIVGDNITTGVLQSLDQINFFNLTNGTFNLGQDDKGMDFGVTNPNTLTIRGAVMADKVSVGSGGVINAYISGITDNGGESIRFSAGPNGEFRVLDNGELFATRLNAQGGNIGAFQIENLGLTNTDGKAHISLSGGGHSAQIGPGVFPEASGYTGAAYFYSDSGVAVLSRGLTILDGAVAVKIVNITLANSYNISKNDRVVVYANSTSDGHIYFPADAPQGMVLDVIRKYGRQLTVHPSRNGVLFKGQVMQTYNLQWWERFVFDGSYWHRTVSE